MNIYINLINGIGPNDGFRGILEALEGMYSDYQGAIEKFWMVDDHPDKLKFMKPSSRESSKRKTGWYTRDGWISYRGRLIPFPRVYEGLRKTDELRREKRMLEHKVFTEEYTCLYGDCFKDHPNPNYPKGQTFTVYVKSSVWNKMSREDQWNYVRDLSVNGWKTPWSIRKKYEDYHKEKMSEELELLILNYKSHGYDRSLLVNDREFYEATLMKDLEIHEFEESCPDLAYGPNSLWRRYKRNGNI